jgi:hypothetical protein
MCLFSKEEWEKIKQEFDVLLNFVPKRPSDVGFVIQGEDRFEDETEDED